MPKEIDEVHAKSIKPKHAQWLQWHTVWQSWRDPSFRSTNLGDGLC